MDGLGDADQNDDGTFPIEDDSEIVPDPVSPEIIVEYPDGSITINLGGIKAQEKDSSFDDNLAEILSGAELASLADDLLRDIDEDDQSRSDWLEECAEGIKLLGLKIMKPSSGADASGSVEGMSRTIHPLLLEAALRFQANASGELMPADGPVKIRDDDQDDLGTESDSLAECLQKDMNHYMTAIATEYYADTDRMLLPAGLHGSGFKKVYRCPIRRRPVSESVDASNLIVSNTATDLGNAERITHVIKMRRSILRRMQILKAYRDVDLGQSVKPNDNAVDQARTEQSGVRDISGNPENDPYTIYECYCLLDIPGFEHKENGEITGIPLPYKVVMDKGSRQVLEIRRDWEEDDEMQQRRETFVHYLFLPGFGFYGIGLQHILGNSTMAATALQRIIIDAGSFANFPGFLYAKVAGRQNTNMFRVPPGGGAPIETGGLPINQVVMPLPYHEAGPGIVAAQQDIVTTAQRVGGTAELQVAEGRQDAPVGTTLAMIEQATKIMNAVHKRLCRAQAKELQLFKKLFQAHPEDFWRFNKKPATDWHKQKLLAALENNDFVPAADPNTSSNMQRIMTAQGVFQMAQASPGMWNLQEVQKWILNVLGVDNPENLMAPPQQQGPDPKAQAALVGAQADMIDAQTKAGQLQFTAKNSAVEDENRDKDRQSKERIAELNLQRDAIIHKQSVQADLLKHVSGLASTHAAQNKDIISDHAGQERQLAGDLAMQTQQHLHDRRMQGLAGAAMPKGNQ